MNSIGDVWAHIIQKLEGAYSPSLVETWMTGVRPLALDGNVVKLLIPSDFQRDVISTDFAEKIAFFLEALLGFEVKLELLSAEERARAEMRVSREIEDQDATESPGQNDYTFSNFIVGNSNKFAHAACKSITKHLGDSFNPLFIYGGSGLGKTHLLYAIRNELQRFGKTTLKVHYIKGDDFTNEMVDSLGMGQSAMRAFREKYRFLDVLLIDDIQFIGGKESTQEEFFHTFNTLYEANKQIVLTSDRPPKEIKTLEDRQRTRFEWGLIADIQAPDIETRTAILNRKSRDLGVAMTPEVADYIAGRLKKDIRQLEGTVKKIKALVLLDHREINIETAEAAIAGVLSDNISLPLLIDRAFIETSAYFSVSVEDIKGNRRNADFIQARQVCMYILREITSMSLKQIGDLFGGKDHTTVRHSILKIEREIEEQSDLRGDIDEIIGNIRQG
ncbi:MAG: chromosomal replication initiator protein DnaA [Clostridiales bacterium]|nr:chromosomal replication initiator protein DnaA [Clostridiales bacterium]